MSTAHENSVPHNVRKSLGKMRELLLCVFLALAGITECTAELPEACRPKGMITLLNSREKFVSYYNGNSLADFG